jgi:hypothetical protein
LHDLLLFSTDHGFLLSHAFLRLLFGLHLLSANKFLLLKLSNPLLLLNHLVLLLSIQLSLSEEYVLSLFILDLYDTLLFDLLLLTEVYSLLYLLSLNLSLLPHLIDPLLIFFLHHLLYTELFHFLMNLHLVFLLECEDFVGTFLCLFDLFPCTHLFLFQEGDTVGKKLSVSLNAIQTNKSY